MKYASHTHQTGAALVVALILLIALSLMAISSMNTASLDLIMAGNEQYRSRAFFAAEAGIENALMAGVYSTSADDPGPGAVSVGSGSDNYTYTITRPNAGAVEAAPPGNSEGTFGSVYFRINSTGNSERNSGTTHVQELYQVVPTGDSLDCNTALASCTID